MASGRENFHLIRNNHYRQEVLDAMSDYTTITNNVPRDVLDASQLTAKERADFDYLDWDALERGEDSASFFRYKGTTYDLGDAERSTAPPADSPLAQWDGFYGETFFSSVVFRYVDDYERVVVGRIYS